jgi:hypothetical protein
MENFKLSFTDSTTFAGKDLEGFYAAALLKGTSKESFKLIPDVKSTAKLGLLDVGNILQDADCTFTSGGEGTLSQKTVTAHPFKVNLEYCQRTFERDYLSLALRAGSNSDASIMPATVEEYLLNRVANKINNDLEIIAWQGSGATVSANFTTEPGLVYKLANDGNVIKQTGVTLSSSVIVAEINKVYDKIPAVVKDNADLAIYMNAKTAGFYKQAQAASYTGFYSEEQKLTFLGVPIIVAGGMPDNKMVAAVKSNLLLLTDLMSDFEDILILPQKSVTGVPVIRFVAEGKIGFDYVISNEIVLYAI